MVTSIYCNNPHTDFTSLRRSLLAIPNHLAFSSQVPRASPTISKKNCELLKSDESYCTRATAPTYSPRSSMTEMTMTIANELAKACLYHLIAFLILHLIARISRTSRGLDTSVLIESILVSN
uniref:Ovule protein n=1 Tax=Steinernema glaseri TaxID=37863 RepID=A0A1I8A7B1_9BILA